MRTVSGDSLSKGDKMSQVETFPSPHNANRQLAEPPPPHSLHPLLSRKLGGGGEHRVGETKVWMGKKERKIQLNYHCFNIEFSLISLMLAETKFITLLHSGKVQGGALEAGMPRPGDVSRGLFSLPVHGALLTDFFPQSSTLPLTFIQPT